MVDEELLSWDTMTKKEKNHQLYLKQKALLDELVSHHAISDEQYEKSLADMTEKMGEL